MPITRIITVPDEATKDWIVSQKGELLGDLWNTRNIDLESSKGKVRLSERLYTVLNSVSEANWSAGQYPRAFMRSNADGTDRYWAMVRDTSNAGAAMWNTPGTDPTATWSRDGLPTPPLVAKDSMELFLRDSTGFDRLCVGTSGGDIAMLNSAASPKWNLTWWTGTLAQTAFNTSNPIVMRKFNVNKLLLIGNSNFVHTIDQNLNVNYKRLTFPDSYSVNCIVAAPDYAWIFLKSVIGGHAIAARWDGGEGTYEAPISLNDPMVYAAVIKEGIPYCVNGKGQILMHNGQAFEQVAVFPVFYEKRRWTDNSDYLSSTVMNRNGIAVIDGIIHMFVKGTLNNVEADMLENMRAGIWALTKDNGLYCKYQVADDSANPYNWGVSAMSNVGAIVETTMDKGHFLVGGEIFTDNITTKLQAIWASRTSGSGGASTTSRGQIITRQFHVSVLSGMFVHEVIRRILWDTGTISFEYFADSTNRIIVKARYFKNPNFTWLKLQPCTWSNTTTFTSTSTNLASAAAGNEIEIISGAGAGATLHISTITNNAGTYTVVLDEAITNASGTFAAYLNQFYKVADLSSTSQQDGRMNIYKKSSFIQIKVELRGGPISPELKNINLSYIGLKI